LQVAPRHVEPDRVAEHDALGGGFIGEIAPSAPIATTSSISGSRHRGGGRIGHAAPLSITVWCPW
jgi:hypothetical protein